LVLTVLVLTVLGADGAGAEVQAQMERR